MTDSSDREASEARLERRKRRKDRRVNAERRGPDRVVTVESPRRRQKRRGGKPDQ